MKNTEKKINETIKKDIAELILQAKGPLRTMSEFAKEIDISIQKLSRIVTGNYVKKLPLELIYRINKNRYDVNDSRLLSRLICLNDYSEPTTDLTENENMPDGGILIKIKEFILSKLLRLHDVTNIHVNKKEIFKDFNTSLAPDLSVSINSDDTNAELSWYFYFFIDSKNNTYSSYKNVAKSSFCFLLDSNNHDVLKNTRVSFVFSSEEKYNNFLTMYSKLLNLSTPMSAILINLEDCAIQDETMLPGKYDKSQCFDICGFHTIENLSDDFWDFF